MFHFVNAVLFDNSCLIVFFIKMYTVVGREHLILVSAKINLVELDISFLFLHF